MDVGILVSEAMRYSASDFKKLIIFGLLFLISILIIPFFLVLGYQLRIIKYSINGSNELPPFDNWREMFFDGLKVFFVQFVYFLIPGVVILLGLYTALYSILFLNVSGVMSSPEAILSLLGGSFVVGIILAIGLSLLFIIGLANLAYRDSELKAAFQYHDLLNIINKIGWVDYLVWYIVMVIIGFVIAFISSFLGFIPVLGWIILMLIFYPFTYIFFSRSLALLFLSGFEKPEFSPWKG